MLRHENNQFADTGSFISASQTLPESEVRRRLFEHQKLIQASLDGFLVVRTTDARIVEVNNAFCDMVGYSREELLTMHLSDLEADESPAETAAHIKNIKDDGYDRFETRHRHKQGHLINLEVSVSHPAMDGSMNFAFARDITERKRTEDALYFVAQRSWMGSAENFFDALARYLGETLGVDYVVIDRLNEEPGIAETVALYTKGEIVQNMSYDLKCREMGAESYAGTPLWDSSGQPIGVISVMDSKPFSGKATISKVLKLVAIRAAAELERERNDCILKEREREFRTLAENMPDNVIRYDRQCRVQYVNPAMLTSVAPELQPVLGETPAETFPDNDGMVEYQQELARVIATGDGAGMEIQVPNPQGEMRTHHIRYVAQRDDAGVIIGALAIGRDITDLKRMEQEVAARECELRALAESSPGMMGSFHLRTDGTICMPYVSPNIFELFGLHPQDVAEDASSLMRLTHPDDAQRVSESIAESARTMTPWRHEYRILHPTRGERWMEGHTNPVPHPAGGVIWYGYVHDITARKQAEALLNERLHQIGELNSNLEESARTLRMQTEELAASQEHLKQTETWYRSILHSAPDGMVVADEQGKIVMANAQAENIFGYAPGELTGLPIELLLPPDKREGHVGMRADFAVATAGDKPKSIKARNLSGYRKDGVELPLDLSLSRLPDTDEMVGYICAAMRDITERKEMEQERINHLSRLAEVSRSLVSAQESARQRLARELHDRTSPNLAAIDINLNVIASEVVHGAPPDLTGRLEDIRALISDTAASIREVGAEMRPPLLDYAGLIAAMENHALLFARRTGIRVHFECDHKDRRYTAQIESLLFRIFQEALTNCSKHSSANSIRISLCNDISPNILTITDDGVGFDPAQLSKTRKIGLGLLNMREMAEVAGVKIAIESAIGKGTSITVVI